MENDFLIPDQKIISKILSQKDCNNFKLSHYLFSGIKNYITSKQVNNNKKLIEEKYQEKIEIFEEKCRKGENDSYICSLIRNDSVEEFISFINQKNIPLNTKI